jgi:hypothetical protein
MFPNPPKGHWAEKMEDPRFKMLMHLLGELGFHLRCCINRSPGSCRYICFLKNKDHEKCGCSSILNELHHVYP